MTISLARSPRVLALFASVVPLFGCSEGAPPAPPGVGDLVAPLADGSVAMAVVSDGAAVHVLATGDAKSPVTLSRVAPGGLVPEPLGALVGFDATQVLDAFDPPFPADGVVRGGTLYVGGLSSVLELPLDGSPTTAIAAPQSAQPGMDVGIVGAIATDGDSVFACYSASTTGPSLWKHAAGAWTLLFTAGAGERCTFTSMALGDGAVLWGTEHYVRRTDVATGATTTLVAITEPASSMVWSDGALFVAAWESVLRVDPKSGASVHLLDVDPNDAVVETIAVDGGDVYAISQTDLRRVGVDGSGLAVLAHHDVPGGFFGLAVGGGRAYFADVDLPGDGGTRTTLRSVAE